MAALKEMMSKRERVEAAMDRRETDRTPVYDILVSDAVIEHLTGRWPPTGEEGLRLRLEATARSMDMTRMVGAAPAEPGEWVDEDGFVHSRIDRWRGGGIRRRPFTDERGARAWLEKAVRRLREPVDADALVAAHREHVARCRAWLGDDTVVIAEYGTGLDWVRYPLGLEMFSYLSVDAPELISEYIALSTGRELERIRLTADRETSPCALTYGDIAFKQKLMHSPAWLRREFFPHLARIQAALHERGIKCLFHSDGYLMEITDDLIASGIDGLNPIETVAGMDLAEVKRLYGDRLFLTGGIDISQLMALGTPEDVRRECRRAIDVASPGYFIGSTTEIDNGSRLENVLAMWETAREHAPGG